MEQKVDVAAKKKTLVVMLSLVGKRPAMKPARARTVPAKSHVKAMTAWW
jgi:hypothetical protein